MIIEFGRLYARLLSRGAWSAPAKNALSIDAHPCSALPQVRNLEYFHDHMRFKHVGFDEALIPVNGALDPDLSHPVLEREFKRAVTARYAV